MKYTPQTIVTVPNTDMIDTLGHTALAGPEEYSGVLGRHSPRDFLCAPSKLWAPVLKLVGRGVLTVGLKGFRIRGPYLQGPKRPHKHKDLKFWFQDPKRIVPLCALFGSLT